MAHLQPIKFQADIEIIEPTEELKRDVASIVKFPDKSPDLMFFHGIMVSTGTNLNDAHFLGSEIIKARNTIVNKALDIEHEEDQIVGHIYSYTLLDHNNNVLDVASLEKLSAKELDTMDIDVHIGGIVYKNRFPELAEEVKDGKWKLSMETYYQNYDIKVGNVIMTRQEAEALGIASEKTIGKLVRLLKSGVEMSRGEIARVLRSLLFSGCGIVKNPAEPRAVILETAKVKQVIDMKIDMKDVVAEIIGDVEVSCGDIAADINSPAEIADESLNIRQQTSVGICVSYKKIVYSHETPGPDTEVIHNDWCALYETNCTSASRGADDRNCLRNIEGRVVARVDKLFEGDRRKELLIKLKSLL